MGEVIFITSGKGGVGKTTVTANLGKELARSDKKVMLLDFDFGLRNLDIILGLEQAVVYDISDVLEGRCRAAPGGDSSLERSADVFSAGCR